MKRIDIVLKNEDGTEQMICVKTPGPEELEAGDRAYASTLAKLFREPKEKRLLLRSQLHAILKQDGIWTDEDEAKVGTLQTEIGDLLNKVRKGGIKESEGRKLCLQIQDKRNEIMQTMAKLNQSEACTIEGRGDEERLESLLQLCCVYASSGESYWPSLEDMKNSKQTEAYRKASDALVRIVYNVDEDFEKKLPENRWMIKHGYMDEGMKNFIDKKTKEPVDRDGNPLAKEQEKFINNLVNLQGEIIEETPFIDDETNTPV